VSHAEQTPWGLSEAEKQDPPDGFLERLEARAESLYHHRHPFNALMHAGRLDQGDLRLWAANRYYYQTRIPIKDALIVAKAESHAFRHLWMQRLLDHDGRDDPRVPGSVAAAPGGLELWRRLGNALGVGDAELEAGSLLLPDVRTACDEYVERVRDADLLTAVAFSLTEHFAPRLMQLRIEAWLQHYPFVPEQALDYFKQRVTRAKDDSELALAYVRQHARTEAEQERCLTAFEQKCSILWRLLDAVYLARRCDRVPRIERRAWLMKLSALAAPDPRGQPGAPGVLMLSERALSLNRTAFELLECCEGQLTLAQVMTQLAHHHGVARETVERDVATFIAELEQRRVLAFEGESER
jgi:pyrroloquinoline-quinone synthase